MWQVLHQRGRSYGLSVSPILVEPALAWCESLGYGIDEVRWVFFLDDGIYPALIESNESDGEK